MKLLEYKLYIQNFYKIYVKFIMQKSKNIKYNKTIKWRK